MSQAAIRPQVILSHCIHAFEVRGGRLDSPTNAPAAATQNGRLAQGQSPGAGHDGAALLRLRRRSSCGVALASAGFHDECWLFAGRMKFRNDSSRSRWDLSSDGFWSKKSIRELLSLLLLRHGMVCGGCMFSRNMRTCFLETCFQHCVFLNASYFYKCGFF